MSSTRWSLCCHAARLCGVAMLWWLVQAEPAAAVIKAWNAGNGSWSTAGNWLPAGVPQLADTALIGNSFAAENATVSLGANQAISGLGVTDGMTIRTNGFGLVVVGDSTFTGMNNEEDEVFRSGIVVEPSPGIYDYGTTDLFLHDGAQAMLINGAIRVSGEAYIDVDSRIVGSGVVDFFSHPGTSLINDGTIAASNGLLVISDDGDGGVLDLDGGAGNGRLAATFGNLTIDAASLDESFSGDIELSPASMLQMSIPTGWTADADSRIFVYGLGSGFAPSQISGGEVTLGGTIQLDGAEGHLRINPSAILQPTVQASLAADTRLEFAKAVELNGGHFDIGEQAYVDFMGDTIVDGGTFEQFNPLDLGSGVRFQGPTTYAGLVTFNGRAHQLGNATVTGITTINAGTFNMDGGGSTDWNINASLTINADRIDNDIEDVLAGTWNIGGGILSTGLTINLTDPEAAYTFYGSMHLSGAANFVRRLNGSPVRIEHYLGLSDSNVEIWADTTFADFADVDFAAAGSDLRMRGRTVIESEAEFHGEGLLHNGAGGDMTLEPGASLDEVGLNNTGTLRIGPEIGGASVDRFTNGGTGVLQVKIGGYAPFSEYDRWTVSGGAANLAGTLAIYLAGDGSMFLPEPDDDADFVVLTAVSGVAGEFNSVPPTSVGGVTTHWYVEYLANLVIAKVDGINGVPGDYNYDGIVNAADYTVWRNALGNTGIGMDADGDGDGTIDVDDYNVWKSHYGEITKTGPMPVLAATTSHPVPEPQTLAWCVALAIAALSGKIPRPNRTVDRMAGRSSTAGDSKVADRT